MLIAFLAGTGCNPSGPDCTRPEVFCIGLVTQVGRVDDGAANQSAWEAIQQAKSEGVANKVAVIETIDSRDYDANMRVFAEAGYDVVVTVGDNAGTATYTTAETYPNVYFIGTDQHPSPGQGNRSNLIWLIFPEEHMGFLAGALAASVTRTEKVAAVCGSDVVLPMKLYGDGFLAGVIYINPKIKATVTYHNEVSPGASLNDPAWGEAAANSLIDQGADIIFAAGGTTADSALEAAAARNGYAIGAEIDQYMVLPAAASRMLTSVLKLISPGVLDLLSAARQAQESKSSFRTGIYFGQIDFAPYHELAAVIPNEVKQQMAALPAAILSGEIHPNELLPTP